MIIAVNTEHLVKSTCIYDKTKQHLSNLGIKGTYLV